MDVILIHLAVDQCLAAFEMVYHDKAGAVEVTDFDGQERICSRAIARAMRAIRFRQNRVKNGQPL
jgi:hypothetical protein